MHLTALEEAEAIPGKHSDTNTNQNTAVAFDFDQPPQPLHSCYLLCHNRTDTCFRWGMAVANGRYKILTVSLLKRLRNGRFRSETVIAPGSRSTCFLQGRLWFL
jgi:hypothetical protein